MKNLSKFLLIAGMALMLCKPAGAQTTGNGLSPALDTNTNVQTQYLTTPALAVGDGNFAFQYIGTKISGTVAGTVILEGSLDGIVFKQVGSSSLTLADAATNTYVWDVTQSKRMYYRLNITTSGTVALQNKGYYVTRTQ